MAVYFFAGKLALGVFLLVFSWEMKGGSGEVMVSLEMIRYAPRGSSITLHCAHNVQPELLYKVEWLRDDGKIFQYVRERRPPFRNYTVVGAHLNMSHCNESTITLDDLDFAASGNYYCAVSLETPIYTKASVDKELVVVQPQKHPPRITFGAPLYTAGELVEANCTSSPAHPSPHITWFINGVKVDPSLSRSYTRLAPIYRGRKRHRSARSRLHPTAHPGHTAHHRGNNQIDVGNPSLFDRSDRSRVKSCSARDVYGDTDHVHNHTDRTVPQLEDETTRHPPTSHHKSPGHLVLSPGSGGSMGPPRPMGQRLSMAISALRLAAGGRLSLTCLATIPAYRGPSARYADARNHTVIIDVVVAEELEPEPTEPEIEEANAGNKIISMNHLLVFIILLSNFHLSPRLFQKLFLCSSLDLI